MCVQNINYKDTDDKYIPNLKRDVHMYESAATEASVMQNKGFSWLGLHGELTDTELLKW